MEYKGGDDVCAYLVAVCRVANDHSLDYEQTIKMTKRVLPHKVKSRVSQALGKYTPAHDPAAVATINGKTYIATLGEYTANMYLSEVTTGTRRPSMWEEQESRDAASWTQNATTLRLPPGTPVRNAVAPPANGNQRASRSNNNSSSQGSQPNTTLPRLPNDAAHMVPIGEQKWKRLLIAVMDFERRSDEVEALGSILMNMTRRTHETDLHFADRIDTVRDVFPLASWADRYRTASDDLQKANVDPTFTDTRAHPIESRRLTTGFSTERAMELVRTNQQRVNAGKGKICLWRDLVEWVREQDHLIRTVSNMMGSPDKARLGSTTNTTAHGVNAFSADPTQPAVFKRAPDSVTGFTHKDRHIPHPPRGAPPETQQKTEGQQFTISLMEQTISSIMEKKIAELTRHFDRGEQHQSRSPTKRRQQPTCRFFDSPRGCSKGDDCNFAHGQQDNNKRQRSDQHADPPPCIQMARGSCDRAGCKFSHAPGAAENYQCRDYHRGACQFGDKCVFKHSSPRRRRNSE